MRRETPRENAMSERDDYRTASLSLEIYIQVKDAAGNWATLRVLVPR